MAVIIARCCTCRTLLALLADGFREQRAKGGERSAYDSEVFFQAYPDVRIDKCPGDGAATAVSGDFVEEDGNYYSTDAGARALKMHS